MSGILKAIKSVFVDEAQDEGFVSQNDVVRLRVEITRLRTTAEANVGLAERARKRLLDLLLSSPSQEQKKSALRQLFRKTREQKEWTRVTEQCDVVQDILDRLEVADSKEKLNRVLVKILSNTSGMEDLADKIKGIPISEALERIVERMSAHDEVLPDEDALERRFSEAEERQLLQRLSSLDFEERPTVAEIEAILEKI